MQTLESRLWSFFKTARSRPTSIWLLALPVAAVGVLGVLDYWTGYEVTFFPFYSFPILFALWFRSRGEAIFIALLSALSWWIADTASGHIYLTGWHHFFDLIECLLFFFLVVAAAVFREEYEAKRLRIELLEHSHRLEQEIINITERERQRIGRDLHDDLGQYLVAIGFAADALKKKLEDAPPPLGLQAHQIADQIHQAVVRARDLSRGLSPVDRDAGGLESALEQLSQSASRLSGVTCSLIVDGAFDLSENATAVHLYRIAQEALNNALKHSRAKMVVIALEADAGRFSLRISDDGTGFDPRQTGQQGMGLNIMRYRARTIGGRLEIEPNPPSGTVVTCTIEPVAAAAPQASVGDLYEREITSRRHS